MRFLLVLALGAGALAFGSVAAQAATLTNAGGTLTFTAARGKVNDVSFSPGPSPNSVDVFRNTAATVPDNDPIADPTGCTSFAAGVSYRCEGVTALIANGGDLGDSLRAGSLTTLGATLIGGPGDDLLLSGDGPDTVDGGDGDDGISTEGGVDTLQGARGNDRLWGGSGADVLDGDVGDDYLDGEIGADRVRGGDGLDSTFVMGNPDSSPPQPATSIFVALDGQANDGRPGEGDNITEVEDVEAMACGVNAVPCPDPRAATLVGDAAGNALTVKQGLGDIDGGPGGDVLTGGENNDTIRARDGFPDRVVCNGGADTAIIDQLDTVSASCEAVQAAFATPALEDFAPLVSWGSPASGAKLGTKRPTTLTANASDDQGVAKVQFLDDERLLCEDAAAPFDCAYSPQGGDVGRNTLVAVAVDGAGQTASAVRAVTVGLFAPTVSLKVTPKRDRRAPFKFKASGRLNLPAGVTPSQGCTKGRVVIEVKAGRKRVSRRAARLSTRCAFTQKLSFRSRRAGGSGKLKLRARYAGNAVLSKASSKSVAASAR